MNKDQLFHDLPEIPKKIHVTWRNKNILDLNFSIIRHGIRNLRDLNLDYKFEISDNTDVNDYIKKNISAKDFDLIKHKKMVEKSDLWRLLKIYNEGGVYTDIDRFCNQSLCKIIKPEVKCVLPMYQNIDFSQDIMISSPGNPIHKRAIDLNLERRRHGCVDILSLAPITYFHAVTEVLLGEQLARWPSKENINKLNLIINRSKYLQSCTENPQFDTFTYQGPPIFNDKMSFYHSQEVNHWTFNYNDNTEIKYE
jgi:hypothetical protein